MQIQPYLYYPEIDKLIRFKQPLVYGPPRGNQNGLVGSMVFYMLLRMKTMIDKAVKQTLEASLCPMCGWRDTLKSSGYKYFKVVQPEQKREERVLKRKREEITFSDDVKELQKLHKQFRAKRLASKVSIFLQYFKLCIPQCQKFYQELYLVKCPLTGCKLNRWIDHHGVNLSEVQC